MLRWWLVLSKNNNLADGGWRRGAFWAALFSIAWLQLSVAAHQFDHFAEQIEDSCHVCVQLDRVDDAIANHSTSAPFPSAINTLARQAPASVVDRAFIRGFDSRAPPQL